MPLPVITLSLILAWLQPAMAWVDQSNDWLLSSYVGKPSSVTESHLGGYPAITISNGIIARTFSYAPCFTTIEYELLPTRTKFLRALSPEATMTLNGEQVVVGNCLGQMSGHSEFWDPSSTHLRRDPLSLEFVNYQIAEIEPPFSYTPGEGHSPRNVSWPPKGLHLIVNFRAPSTGLPSNASTNLTGPFKNLEYPCAGPCLVGFPSCNTSAVPGQCSWPREQAAIECGKWQACLGINCNPTRSDCQARGAPLFLQASAFDVFLKMGPSSAPNATVSLHYQIYDGLAVLHKWITVSTSEGNVEVDNLFFEYLRAPNFAPEQMTVFQIQPDNPTPFSQQIKPEIDQSFPGRTQQLWFLDSDWDACCDRELHVPYTYYTFLKVGYGPDITFGGMTGPGTLVTPDTPFESIGVRVLLHDTTDWERQGIATRRMQEVLAPQLMESPLYTMITDISSTAAFRLAITTAAAAGFEYVLVGFGAAGYCGMCQDQIGNTTWVAWFKEQVEFANSLGLGVGAYTLMQHNAWGESVPRAEQVLNRDGTRGGIACFATEWHAMYRKSVIDFAKTVGLYSIETDGQYEGAACADEGGDHHHNGLAGSWHAQTQATAEFNIALKYNGIYQTGADAYFWSGANKWNHADTDAGYALPSVWERLSVGRDYVFDSTTTRLHSSGMYGIGDIASDCRALDPIPGRLQCIDFALASFLGQGVVSDVVARVLWEPTDPQASQIQAIFSNWSAFFSKHRAILTSAASLHIVRPTSRSYEAIAHLLADLSAPERAFVTLYNPTSSAISDHVAVSLYYAGLSPGTKVAVTQLSLWNVPGSANLHVVGSDGGAIYDVVIPFKLGAYSYALFSVSVK